MNGEPVEQCQTMTERHTVHMFFRGHWMSLRTKIKVDASRIYARCHTDICEMSDVVRNQKRRLTNHVIMKKLCGCRQVRCPSIRSRAFQTCSLNAAISANTLHTPAGCEPHFVTVVGHRERGRDTGGNAVIKYKPDLQE